MKRDDDDDEEQLDWVNPKFGRELHKLSRRGGIDTSAEAAATVDTTEGEREVYELTLLVGERGITNSEAAKILRRMENHVSPRWSSLIEKKLVVDTGKRRRNHRGRSERIVVAAKYAQSAQP